MIMPVRAKCAVCVASFVVLVGGGPAAAQDSFTAARDLYASAAYEDALAMLNRLREPSRAPTEERAVEQYRMLCLLALNRAEEAQKAIEVIVAAEPGFRLSESDISPRVRSTFSDVRRRMLPALIQQQYGRAKAVFDQKNFSAAADGFSRVLEMLADSDIGVSANQPPLSDLRTLAAGFRDLSVTAATPPPPAAAAASPAAPSVEPPATRTPPAPRVYGADDGNVVPPTVVRQSLPPFPSKVVTSHQGALVVIVSETGAVESATMRIPISSNYDRAILEAARQWRYRPATLDGVPVKFRRVVQINVTPS